MDDEELNVNLITAIQKFEFLFNPQHKEYFKRERTEQAWAEVANEMHKSESWCKAKWKNLRTVFLRHLREKTCNPGAPKKRKYYLYDKMQFIIPYTKHYKEPGSLIIKTFDEIEEHFLSSPLAEEYNSSNNNDINLSPLPNANTEIENETAAVRVVPPSRLKNMKTTQPNQAEIPSNDDGFRSFFDSLLPDITPLTAKRKRLLKSKIVLLINELHDEQEAEIESHHNKHWKPTSASATAANNSYVTSSPPTCKVEEMTSDNENWNLE